MARQVDVAGGQDATLLMGSMFAMAAGPHAPAPGVSQGPLSSCVWCGGACRPIGSRLALCGACGAASTCPLPGEEELRVAYSCRYRPAAGRFAGGGDRLLRRSRATLARRLDRLTPPGPVLDVGCGDGALLDALHARGRDAVGLERSASRPNVCASELTSFHERAGEWAAIVFWHSLEHLSDPGAALDRASVLLAPGGLLVIAMPNWGSWQAHGFGDRWLALDLPRHLVHLPASALIEGVGDRGLRIGRVSYWRGGQVMFGWLHGLVGGLPGHPDLYDAIRQPEARRRQLGGGRRLAVLTAGVALAPVALVLAVAEVAARASGTVYLEAWRA